jgi:hypothetical protein
VAKSINLNKYDNISVSATGRDCPTAFESFDEVGGWVS